MLRILALTVAASLLNEAHLVADAYEPPAVSTHFSGRRQLLQGSPAATPSTAEVINGTDVFCDKTLCLTASADGSPDVELLKNQALGFIDSTTGIANQEINATGSTGAQVNAWYVRSHASAERLKQ